MWRRLLRSLGTWLLRLAEPKPDDPVVAAVRSAYAQAGCPSHLYQPDTDLLQMGKLDSVIHFAAESLGSPLRTIEDVENLLR